MTERCPASPVVAKSPGHHGEYAHVAIASLSKTTVPRRRSPSRGNVNFEAWTVLVKVVGLKIRPALKNAEMNDTPPLNKGKAKSVSVPAEDVATGS
jgi:hypothetical protein